MSKNIVRKDINESYAYSGSVKAGNLVFLNFCARNVGKSTEEQIIGALEEMKERLQSHGLTMDSVVQVTAMFRDVWDIPLMEKAFKEYFPNGYPARKTIQTEFAHQGGENGLKFQLDGIAYCGE